MTLDISKALEDFRSEMGSTLQIVYQTDIQSNLDRVWVCWFNCWDFMGLELQGKAAKGVGHSLDEAVLRCHKRYLVLKAKPHPNNGTWADLDDILHDTGDYT